MSNQTLYRRTSSWPFAALAIAASVSLGACADQKENWPTDYTANISSALRVIPTCDALENARVEVVVNQLIANHQYNYYWEVNGPNQINACAATTVTNDNAVDCTAIENVESVECKPDGTCLVNSCKSGYHIADTRDGCLPNTPQACGIVTAFGHEVRNCTLNAAAEGAQCNDLGICEVSLCEEDYHLSLDKRRCEKNTKNGCGEIDSSVLENCENYGKNYECIAGKCVE